MRRREKGKGFCCSFRFSPLPHFPFPPNGENFVSPFTLLPMLTIEIVAPDGRIFQGEADSVRAPGVEGSFQVLTGHAPMLAAFEIGPLFVTPADGERITFATSGGFLEVLNDTVTVLAETAEPEDEIDTERARAAEERARERMAHAEDTAEHRRAEEAAERARNRLRNGMGEVARR